MASNPGVLTISQPKTKWTIYHSAGLVAMAAAMILIALSPSTENPSRVIPWLAILAILIASSVLISSGTTGSWRGILIDNRNKVSVSRTQMYLWTILVISAVITAGISNIRLGSKDSPLSFDIPSELWLLMGISTTSLVASPLIRSTKAQQKPDPKEVGKTIVQMQQQSGKTPNVDVKGVIVVNEDMHDASFADMFKGEEAGNAVQLDLAKVQMFYFTLGTVIAYGTAIASMFASADVFSKFPAISQGMVALLGISHAGYLTNKAIRHTDPAQDGPAFVGDGTQIETETTQVQVKRSTQTIPAAQIQQTAPTGSETASAGTAISPDDLAKAKG